MDVVTACTLVVVGLILLAVGGEGLVRAATTLAAIAGVSPAVIGLTVVAIGTSLPELVVSLVAGAQGQPDIAVANVVGSNIFNIGFILGLTALILPLSVHGSAVKLEWPVMFVASAMALVLSRDGVLDRLEGALFIVVLVMFIAYTVHVARRDLKAAEAQQHAEEAEARDIDVGAPKKRQSLLVSCLVLAVGLVALIGGGRLLVDGSVALARIAGMSERVIGLTIVAGGTSAPELATSIVAALRGRSDVAVANIIGSNVFNILGILGSTALVVSLPVSQEIVRTDMLWMLGTALLLLPVMRSHSRIGRPEGALLLAVFLVYLGLLLRP